MSKSYVSMATCPICQEPNGTILMDKRIKNSMEQYTKTLDPCDKCEEKYLKDGIMLIGKESENSKEVKGIAVIKRKVWSKVFNLPTPNKKQKFIFCDIKILEHLKAN